jgi:drug/metabolite transporter (DMT)-like permease
LGARGCHRLGDLHPAGPDGEHCLWAIDGSAALSVAAVAILPVGFYEAGASLFSPALIPLALLMALFSSAIPFSLEFYALPRMPSRTFAVLMSLEPAFGVLSGLVILNERLAPAQMAGVAMVIVAAAGAAWSSAGNMRLRGSACRRQGTADLTAAVASLPGALTFVIAAAFRGRA